jgi:hypothetical protein
MGHFTVQHHLVRLQMTPVGTGKTCQPTKVAEKAEMLLSRR